MERTAVADVAGHLVAAEVGETGCEGEAQVFPAHSGQHPRLAVGVVPGDAGNGAAFIEFRGGFDAVLDLFVGAAVGKRMGHGSIGRPFQREGFATGVTGSGKGCRRLGFADTTAAEVAQMGDDEGETAQGGDDAGKREVKREVPVGICAQRGTA